MTIKKQRSILDLNFNELENVILTNTLPEDVTLTGLEHRDDFEKLFKHRNTVRIIAQTLIKEKLKERVIQEPSEMREKRLDLRKMELELKEKKLGIQTQTYKLLLDKLMVIETKVDYLLGKIDRLLRESEEGGE